MDFPKLAVLLGVMTMWGGIYYKDDTAIQGGTGVAGIGGAAYQQSKQSRTPRARKDETPPNQR